MPISCGTFLSRQTVYVHFIFVLKVFAFVLLPLHAPPSSKLPTSHALGSISCPSLSKSFGVRSPVSASKSTSNVPPNTFINAA